MEKQPIALNPNLEALSSADFNRSPLNNQEIAFNSQNFLNNPVKAMLEMVQEAEVERQKRKQLEREADRAREKQDQVKAIKKAYDWKVKKAENLKLALAILVNKKHTVGLIPDFNRQAFLEVVSDNFSPVELWLLADIVYELYEELNSRINEINSRRDMDLYYEFYTFDPNEERAVVADHKGRPVYYYGADIPTTEMREMEDERKLLLDLYCELNDLAEIEPETNELDTLKLALAA